MGSIPAEAGSRKLILGQDSGGGFCLPAGHGDGVRARLGGDRGQVPDGIEDQVPAEHLDVQVGPLLHTRPGELHTVPAVAVPLRSPP